MTTAMSAAHEIKYTIFVYIAEAAKANASTRANGKEITVIGVNGSDSSKTAAASKKLDEVAPEIIGLEYQSETKAEHAKYFKIYHYDQGITLLEIDMSKKTGRKAAGKKWKQSSDTSGLNPAEQEQAALYLNKVVKYLIVPENAEIPAGLDKEVIVVRQPADHIYAGTNKIISKIAKLGQNDKVTAVGVKKKKCKNETIKEKMEKKEDFLFGSQQLIRIYLEQMLIYMIRRNSSPPMTVPVSQFVNLKNNSAVYKRVIAYMEDHIRENITLCDLCHDNMIGRSQLQKIFQEQHQCGAMDFFSRLKIAYARQLIRENQMNFTQISEFLGYSSIHYFSRQFKKISGMTPTEYITSIKALSERERQ